jgi:hypothetical protein
MLVTSLVGCSAVPTTQPSPIILPAFLSGAEQFGLGVAQATINASLNNGKISQAQYDAAETLIIQANNDAKNPAGVTQAQLDSLVEQAIAEVLALEIPIAPIPAAQAKTFVPQPLTASTKALLRK